MQFSTDLTPHAKKSTNSNIQATNCKKSTIWSEFKSILPKKNKKNKQTFTVWLNTGIMAKGVNSGGANISFMALVNTLDMEVLTPIMQPLLSVSIKPVATTPNSIAPLALNKEHKLMRIMDSI